MARVVVDEIVTEYELDPRKYKAGSAAVKSATQGMSSDLKKALTFDSATFASQARTVAIGAGAAIAAALAVGFNNLKDFAQFEGLTKALESIEGSAEAARIQMEKLKDAAKQPGLGFGEAVGGFLKLRNSGVSSDFAQQIVREIGNANARGGGNKGTFANALLAASQISANGKVQGQDILQLVNAGIPVRKMMSERYGTADTEELARKGLTAKEFLRDFIDDLARLPRVAGGAQNSLDNLEDSLHFMSVNVGGAIASMITGGVEDLSNAVQDFNNAGVWADTMKEFATALGLTGVKAKGANDLLLDFVAGLIYTAKAIDFYRQEGPGAIKWLNDLAKLANPASGLASEAIFKGLFGGEKGGGIVTDTYQSIRADIESKVKAGQKPAGQEPGAGGAGTDDKAMTNKVFPVLSQIRENTAPLKDIANQILGGGSLLGRGVSRQELFEVRGGTRGGSRRLDSALTDVVGAIRAMIVNESRGQTTRREA